MLGFLLVEEADYYAEIPGFETSRFGAVGILRLRLAVPFALRQTSLRMTTVWGRQDSRAWSHWRVPTSFFFSSDSPASFPFTCRLKRRRTTSTTVVASDSLAALFSVVIGVCITLLMMPRVRASIAISCSGVI